MDDKETLREAVARIIDPSTWAVLDSYLADAKRKYAKSNAGYDPDAFKDKKSLAKADAAIATMFERLRTPSEGMIEAGDEIIYALNQVPQPEPQSGFVFRAMLTAFQQENSDD